MRHQESGGFLPKAGHKGQIPRGRRYSLRGAGQPKDRAGATQDLEEKSPQRSLKVSQVESSQATRIRQDTLEPVHWRSHKE